MRAIRIHETGGPEVMRLEEVALPEPGLGEVRVRVAFAGINFIDIYHRSGFYPLPSLPSGLGGEGAGRVTAIGPGVEGLAVGDRVGFWDARGAYAEELLVRAERAIPLPEGLGDREAAACLLQGMTAHYLTCTIRPLGPGDTVLVQAIAGGVGLLVTQMAKLLGATVFGTCSTEEKAQIAREAGADHVILYRDQDFVAETLRLTGGRGVDVTIDGVGKTTFLGSVAATRVRGHIIHFGQSSGPPDPIQPRKVLGSRTLSTATLFDYAHERAEMLERAQAVFDWILAGKLALRIDRVLPLVEAAEAHRLLAGRETSGKLLLAT